MAKRILAVEQSAKLPVFQQEVLRTYKATSAINEAMKSMGGYQSMMDKVSGSYKATSAIGEAMKSMGGHQSMMDKALGSYKATSAIDEAMKSMGGYQSMMDKILGSYKATSAINEAMKSMGDHQPIIDRTINLMASSSLIHNSLVQLNNTALFSHSNSELLSTMAGSLSSTSFINYGDKFDCALIESEFEVCSKELSKVSNSSDFVDVFKKLPPLFQFFLVFIFLQVFLPQVNSISANLLTPIVTSYLDDSHNSNREKINDIRKLPSQVEYFDTSQLRFITGNNVRLRIDASTNSEILDEMVLGQVVTVLSKNKNWIEIMYEYESGEVIQGWVFTRYTARFMR